MAVELEGSLRKALLKGRLWMGKSKSSLEEGEDDEASQQPKLQHERRFTARTKDKESSKVYYP